MDPVEKTIKDRVVKNLLSLFNDESNSNTVGQFSGGKRLRIDGDSRGSSGDIKKYFSSENVTEKAQENDGSGDDENSMEKDLRILERERKESGGWKIGSIIQAICNLSVKYGTEFKYYSGAYRRNESITTEEFCESIAAKRTEHLWAIVIEEVDHWHVIHGCKLSNQSCRCFDHRLAGRNTKRKYLGELGQREWQSIFHYFLLSGTGKRAIYAKIRTNSEPRLFTGCKIIRFNSNSEAKVAIKRALERSGIADESLWNEEGAESSNDEELSMENGTFTKRKYEEEEWKGKKYKKIDGLVKLLLSIGASPIQEGLRTSLFNRSEFQYETDYETPSKIAIMKAKEHFTHFKLSDYINYYEKYQFKNGSPLWHCYNHKDFTNVYMSIEKTREYLTKLLVYQWANEEHEYYFNGEIFKNDWKKVLFVGLKRLMLWLNFRAGKLNTYYIVSPPNAGKSMFTDLLQDFTMCSGSMSNWNRHNQFPMQMCDRVRLIVWNEPNFEPSAIDDIKKLTAGDLMTFNVKNKMHQQIQGIPLLITANKMVLPDNKIFRARIYMERWKTAPFLADIDAGRRFHPLVLKELFKETENYFEEDLLE